MPGCTAKDEELEFDLANEREPVSPALRFTMNLQLMLILFIALVWLYEPVF
jgi:hypothetical protein